MGKRSLLTPSLIAIVGLLTISPVLMLVFGSFTEGLGTFGPSPPGNTWAYTRPGARGDPVEHRGIHPGGGRRRHPAGALPVLREHADRHPLQVLLRDHLRHPHDDPAHPVREQLGPAPEPEQRDPEPVPHDDLRPGKRAVRHLHAERDDPRRGAARPPDRLPDHRAGHELLRHRARGVLPGLRREHPAHADPRNAAGACGRRSWPRSSWSSSAASHPSPSRRSSACRGGSTCWPPTSTGSPRPASPPTTEAGRRGDERARRGDPPHLPVPLDDARTARGTSPSRGGDSSPPSSS